MIVDSRIRYPVPFMAESNMAPFSVMEANGTTTRHNIVCIKARAYQAGPPPKVILVNGPSTVLTNHYGSASFGDTIHVRVKGTANAGDICGPTHNSTSLSSGYPGFTCLATGASNTVWVIRQKEPTICRGQATANIAANTATFNCDNVLVLSGLVPVQGSGNTLTVANVYEDYIADNGIVTFGWSTANSQFETFGHVGTHAEVDPLTDFNVNTSTFILSTKTRALRGNWTEPESNAATEHTGTNTCP